jgi:ketosteroid isomerase-like protein
VAAAVAALSRNRPRTNPPAVIKPRERLLMKSISAAAAALVLAALAPLAHAQDTDATPPDKLGLRATDPSSRSEPTVLIPSERNSDADYPTPGTPLASPKPSAPAPATRSATKSATRTKSSPATKASPAPAATGTSGKMGEAAVREMENRWLAALQAHDAATVQTLVADDYIGVTATGRAANKAALIADVRKDKNTYDSTSNVRMDVRMHGNDTAVVVGTTRQVGKDAEGKPFTYHYRWTDTWSQNNGQWLCVGSQSIQVAK